MQSASDQVAQKFELFGVLVIQKFQKCFFKWGLNDVQAKHRSDMFF